MLSSLQAPELLLGEAFNIAFVAARHFLQCVSALAKD